jgi:hypothetical protein
VKVALDQEVWGPEAIWWVAWKENGCYRRNFPDIYEK